MGPPAPARWIGRERFHARCRSGWVRRIIEALFRGFGQSPGGEVSPRSFRSILALVLTAALVHPVVGAPKPEDDIPPRLDLSISKGLAFLAKQQEPDGEFEKDGPKVAITSLALLAFLAAGNAP